VQRRRKILVVLIFSLVGFASFAQTSENTQAPKNTEETGSGSPAESEDLMQNYREPAAPTLPLFAYSEPAYTQELPGIVSGSVLLGLGLTGSVIALYTGLNSLGPEIDFNTLSLCAFSSLGGILLSSLGLELLKPILAK